MTRYLDPVMQVMDEAFDPAFGEAWTRRQISDALARRGTFCLLGHSPMQPDQPQGFALSRQVIDEEELLLIAVRPASRGQGIATSMLQQLFVNAQERGTIRLFLETRDGNPAISLYQKLGFEQIGLRRGYYRNAEAGPIDALTFARLL